MTQCHRELVPHHCKQRVQSPSVSGGAGHPSCQLYSTFQGIRISISFQDYSAVSDLITRLPTLFRGYNYTNCPRASLHRDALDEIAGLAHVAPGRDGGLVGLWLSSLLPARAY